MRVGDIAQDLRYAVRQLRKSPSFAILVTLTIGLGIGANTALFSVINGFLRPLPVKSPDELVVIAADTKGDETGMEYRFSYPALKDLRQQSEPFKEIFAFNPELAGLTSDGKTTQFLYSAVTGDTFQSLGLQPVAGRLFRPGEGETRESDLSIVLGYSYWVKRFGADPGVIGKAVKLDGYDAQIIGVAPKGFHGLYAGGDMDGYAPLRGLALFDRRQRDIFTDRETRLLTVLGRLKPGVSLADAQAAMDVVGRRFQTAYPATEKGIGIRVVPELLARPLPLRALSNNGPTVRRLLLALAALVLTLACLNVANLMLVRATVRDREMAVRAALGSGRGRLILQMLTECSLLAVAGTAAGLVFGKWASDVFAASINLTTDFPTNIDFSFDWNVFFYALAAALFTGLLIGMLPALRVFRTNANSVLHDGGYGSSSSGARLRIRSVLAVSQVAGSLVLLVVAGFFVRNLQHSERIDLGFDPDQMINARTDTRFIGLERQRSIEFYREVLRRVRDIPGVESASQAFSVPMGYIFGGDHLFIDGQTLRTDEQPPAIGYNSIDGDYFETMRIPLLRGRRFTETDDAEGPLVLIVNQTLANRYWPGEDPIGKRVRMGEPGAPLREIVGMVRDSKYLAVFESALPHFYVPFAQQYASMRSLQVRSQMPQEALKAQVQRAILSVEPDMPIADLQTMREALEGGPGGFLLFRLGAIQALAMGVLGLVLATVGVYGVVSYGASQRSREIGIRMAMGAHPEDIRRMILDQGARMVITGAVTGLALAVALMRFATRYLLVLIPTEPMTFALATTLLGVIALIACLIPARRAMKVDPIVVLRHE